jgi:hypothetical protein
MINKFKDKNIAIVSNFPFQDDSEELGRDTNKLKENTANLDQDIFELFKDHNDYNIIIRSGCLAKKSKTREHIFSDPHIDVIEDTSKAFKGKASVATMAINRRHDYNSMTKTFIDCHGNTYKKTTDKNTKISLNLNSKWISIFEKCCSYPVHFGDYWTRGIVKRSAPQVNTTEGKNFIEIVGAKNEPLEYKKYNGETKTIDDENYDNIKVVMNVNGSSDNISVVKRTKGGEIISNSVVYFSFPNTPEGTQKAKHCEDFLEGEFYTAIIKDGKFKSSAGNSSEFFNFVPWFGFDMPVTKDRIIKELNLEEHEIKLIWK